MGHAASKISYPYITFHPGIANGAAIIEGTRITVRSIAAYYQLGLSVDEILTQLPHLTFSQIHSALAYYFDHQEEIDRDLQQSSDIDFWKAQVLRHPKAEDFSQ